MSPGYLFDRWGTYVGMIDDSGCYFDTHGRELGRVVAGREVYHRDGTYRGHIDALGQYWDELGHFLGYLGPMVAERPCVHDSPLAAPRSKPQAGSAQARVRPAPDRGSHE
jgi:hypothetical protein